MIVDDQVDACTLLETLLGYAGHEVISFNSGAEAMAMLQVRKPSLLILDVNMPGMDGLTVLQTIKEDGELKDVTVLMFSADSNPETMARAKRLGAADFLIKGVVPVDHLLTRISELAEQRSMELPVRGG